MVAPEPGVKDGGQRPQHVVDTDPDDDLVPVHVHRLASYGGEMGPVGERQAVGDLHRSGWNSPNSYSERSEWSIAVRAYIRR
jgi:hypothetical protein